MLEVGPPLHCPDQIIGYHTTETEKTPHSEFFYLHIFDVLGIVLKKHALSDVNFKA